MTLQMKSSGNLDLEKKLANRPQKKELEEKNILKSKLLFMYSVIVQVEILRFNRQKNN